MRASAWLQPRRVQALGFAWAAFFVAGPSAHASDEEIMAQMRTQVQSLQERLLGANNAQDEERLRKEIVQVVDEGLAKLSDQARPVMSVMVKLAAPLQAAIGAYLNDAGVFFGSNQSDFQTVKSQGELARRAALVEQMRATNTKLLRRIDSFDVDAANLLRGMPMPPVQRMAILGGMRDGIGKQLREARRVREIEGEILTQYQAGFALLDREWGRWQIDPQTGFRWDNAAAGAEFATLSDRLRVLSEQQQAVQADPAAGTVPGPAR